MPKVYLEKFFGREDFKASKDEKKRRLTQKFLAKHIGVKPEGILFNDLGEILLSNAAIRNLRGIPLEEIDAVTSGGKIEAVYEGLEMAYNDVMSGAVKAGGKQLAAPFGKLCKHVKNCVPAGLNSTAHDLRNSGALEVLTGVGIGGALGLGLWLGRSGFKQVNEGIARGDTGQALKGGRHLFLGGEALLTSAALTSKMGSHALLRTAGAVAKTLAAPFAVVHGVIDVGEGIHHLKNGVQKQDALEGLEGVAEIGMGIGWLAAAFGATPAVVGVSCACLAGKLGVAVVRKRKDKKAQAEQAEQADRDIDVLKTTTPNPENEESKNETILSKSELEAFRDISLTSGNLSS